MLRPFNARQLSLVSGEGRVMVYAALGGRHAGPSTEVHAPTLARRVDELPRHIDIVVFIDVPVPDGALVGLIDDMVAVFGESDADALVRPVPATEAVKRVHDRTVVEGIDRSRLVAVRSPEVLRRSTLERAVERLDDRLWVSPTGLVAASGGRIALFDPHRVPDTLPR